MLIERAVNIVGAEAKPEVDYYGQTKSDDESTGKEVAASRAVTEVDYCGQTKSDNESTGQEVAAARAVIVGAEAKPGVGLYRVAYPQFTLPLFPWARTIGFALLEDG